MSEEHKYFTLSQVAELLGISRIAVYKKVKKGQIKAIKIGRAYAVPAEYFNSISGKVLTNDQKQIVDKAIEKTMADYSETLRLLGRE